MLHYQYLLPKTFKNYSFVNSEKHGGQSSKVSSKPSQTTGTFCLQLGQVNQGPLGPVHNKRLQDGIPQHALPISSIQATHPKIQQRPTSQKLEDKGAVAEEGTPGQFCVNLVFSTQNRWRSETGHQLQMPELLCGVPTLQDGRDSHVQEPRETRRLASESGSEGCLFLSPDPSGPLEIPLFHSRRENVSVHMPPVRSDLSTMGLYQDPQTHAALGRELGFRLVTTFSIQVELIKRPTRMEADTAYIGT